MILVCRMPPTSCAGFILFCARRCDETYILKFGMARRCGDTRILLLPDEPSRIGFGGSIARNSRNTKIFCGNCRKHRAKRSIVLEALFYEIWRKPRTKSSFWKLDLEEASHETIILKAFSVKIVGSIVRNARFGSFCSVKNWRKHRTKPSFWKLFL